MAITSNTYTGNGSNKLFSITFPYIDTTDVDVYLNGTLQTITTQYTFANATTIEFVAAPGAGVKVDLIRSTANDTNASTFFAGSSVRASDLNDNFDQALYTRQELLESTWNKTDDTLESVETWVSSDDYIATTAATANQMDVRHDTLVQTSTPSAGSYQLGKTWLQNDANKTLSIWNGTTWLGVASGGTFTTQPTVIYVDNVNGSDTNDGHRIINPMKTIKAAVASASAGWIIKVAPGVYQETLPIDITVANLSIVGEAQRSCFVHPTVATETNIMFRCNSGTYIDGFTFAGLKATGTRGGNAIDNDATYGLPTNQGWVAGFYPGCSIKKSPYINNCTNFADSGIDNAAFDPNNYAGTGGDLTSGPAGGGIIVDGSLPSVSSPLRSFVVNEFTQVCLDGPGLLVCNNGYAQAVSFFGLFCHYHAKAFSGGQINMEVGTTDFGRYGLIADGKSNAAIFTATANGTASASATTFAINAPTAGGTWFGDANRPAINMLAEVTISGTTYTYPILSSTANGTGWNVVISRPNPSNRAENLGLNVTVPSGSTWSFYLRSMVSTASHTMEYAGSGCNYNALPENGGVPNETNEVVNRNNGKVWLTSTDQSGKFKVGDTFAVDQQTGFVTIDPQSVATNVVSDLSPELGGDLDVLTRNIYSSLGNVYVNDTLEVNSGSAATPAITFNGDTNTGIYRPGADQLAIATGGSERVRVDSSGKLLVGTSSDFDGFLNQISSTSGLQLSLRRTNSNPVYIKLSSGASGDNVGGGGQLGYLRWYGFHTSADYEAARISAEVDGTPGVNNMPGRLVFSTTAYGASTPTERMRIDSTGLMTLAGPGIKFPATQVASTDPNTLDDYEEGTWTPDLQFGGAKVGMTYSVQSGTYTKIGKLVYIIGLIALSNKGSSTGDAIVQGLPFNAPTTGGAPNGGGGLSYWANFVTTKPETFATGGASISLYSTGTTIVSATNANFANNTYMYFYCTYQVS